MACNTLGACKRREFLKTVTMAGLALAGRVSLLASETKKKPNILFFFVDDMGWQDTSEPFWTQRTGLNDKYKTPHMERLARDGMKFARAYACAVCSPSRISLMTGMNAARHKVTKGKPFYLYMAHYAVHGPWEPDNRFIAKYRTNKDNLKPKPAKLKTRYEDYASMIEGLDKSLGDLMEHLRKLGVEKNTIIVFMSDNGAELMTPPNRPLRGAKHQPYEGGTRVPMIVKWPGVTQPDSGCRDEYVIIEDVFPTFLEMAGVRDYKQYGGQIDGRSFVPLLKGRRGLSSERAIFWHSPHYYRKQEPFSAVRQGDWKLIYHHPGRRLELFNLGEDIGETRNLAQENPEKVKALAKMLGDHLREAGGQMPIVKKTGKRVSFPDKVRQEECRQTEASEGDRR